MLDVRQLQVLDAVARTGSLSAAGRDLHYSQPAMSHHLARLEQEVGTPLVVRHGRGVRLTEAGAVLAERAAAILHRLAAATDEVARLAGLHAGRVRVASFPSASATLVPRAVAALAAAHPGVEVGLIEAEPDDALAALHAGACDVVVGFDYPTDDDGSWARTPLLIDDLRLVLPPGVRASRLPDLADRTWIAGCARCRANLVGACRAAGFDPRIAYETDDYVAVQALVAAGLGVAVLPTLALAAATSPQVMTVDVAGLPAREVVALTPNDGVSPASAAFVRQLEGVAAELAPALAGW